MSGASILIAGNKVLPSAAALGAMGTPGAASCTIPYPTGIVTGSPLFVIVRADGVSAAVNTPAGWTEIGSGAAISATCVVRCFYLFATGSESGSLTVTGAATLNGIMFRASNGLSIESGSIAGASAGSTTISAQNVTTTGPNELAVQMMLYKSTNTIASITGESGTDYTEAFAEVNDSTYSYSVQTGAVGSATAITGGTATLGTSSANRAACGFAIVP